MQPLHNWFESSSYCVCKFVISLGGLVYGNLRYYNLHSFSRLHFRCYWNNIWTASHHSACHFQSSRVLVQPIAIICGSGRPTSIGLWVSAWMSPEKIWSGSQLLQPSRARRATELPAYVCSGTIRFKCCFGCDMPAAHLSFVPRLFQAKPQSVVADC